MAHSRQAGPCSWLTLALVELTRALLYAYENPGSLTPARLATLAPLFDVLLDQPEPLATHDVRALMTYVHRAFPKGSPARALIENALPRRSRRMFISIADALIAKGLAKGERRGLASGRRAGRTEGRLVGRSEGLAQAVLGVLEHRSLPIPASIRQRIMATRNEPQLQRWFDRAFTATTAEHVFDDLDR